MKTSNQLVKPYFVHAVGGVVEVPKLPDPAKAEVRQYEPQQPHDMVEFHVTTSTGNTWSDRVTVIADQPFPLGFAIPKSTFEKGLTAGATAQMYYIVYAGGVNPSLPSEVLELSLVL